MLTARVADRRAEASAVARSFMAWGTYRRLAHRHHIRRTQFVRQQLDRVGIGQSLTVVHFSGQDYPLPPSQLGT